MLPRLMILLILLIQTVFLIKTSALSVPEPAKIVNDGLYRLEIQSEDKFLTSVGNGTATRSRWRGTPDQKWRFSIIKDPTSGQQGVTLAPISGQPGIPTIWKITYVGHGKYRFTSLSNGLCFAGAGSSSVGEKPCEKDSPYQRWLVQTINPT